MKSSIYFFAIILALLTLCNCEKALLETDALPPVSLTTGTIGPDSITVTGEIIGVGDGLKDHGHVWSDVDPQPKVESAVSSSAGPVKSPKNFSTTLEPLESGKTYFVRSYAIDIHDRLKYGEPILTITPLMDDPPIADFEIINNNCIAPCTITFNNISRNANRYEWDFDDGSPIDTVGSPEHTFTQAGTYNVTLQAFNGSIASSPKSSPVTVKQVTFVRSYPNYKDGETVFVSPNGYSIFGNNRNGGMSNIFLLQTDLEGEPVNEVEAAYKLSDQDRVEDAVRLSNGQFVVVGSTFNSTENNQDFYYLRTLPDGAPINPTPTNLATTTGNDIAYAVIQDPTSGEVVITGASSINDDILIRKMKPELEPVSVNNRIDLAGIQNGRAIINTPDGGYLIAGTTANDNSTATDILFIKTDGQGNLMTSPVNYGGLDYENAFAIDALPNSNFITTGSTFSFHPNEDIYLIETDQNGAVKTGFPLDYDMGGEESSFDIEALADGSFVVAGVSNQNAFLAKFDSDGQNIWQESFGDTGFDFFRSVKSTPDGGFIATGVKDGVLFLVKTNSLGKI